MRRQAHSSYLVATVVILMAKGTSSTARAAVDFQKDIHPILESRCFDCHGEKKQQGGLRLDTTLGVMKGSDSGEPLFLKGSSSDSQIIRAITSTEREHMMPPKGERLAPEQIASIKAWIDEGAVIPGAAEAIKALQLKTDHWSFQPVKRPEVPQSKNSRAINEIDHFIATKQSEKGLRLSPPAEKATLIRRLYLVMHGLPPSPEEIKAFVHDSRPEAYAELVDRVLASPRYGERWARHWMDVVRYADTNGFETNRPRPTAYHYRDWIIESLNADKPYDQFVREQLAGDALGTDAATGFLVAGAYDLVKSPDVNLSLMQRQDELADMVSTTGTAFMGLALGCARCHNHKFDPIPQKDYYAMQAIFAGVNHGERAIKRSLDPAAERTLAEAKKLKTTKEKELEALRQKALLASGHEKRRPPVNPRINEERFTPVLAQSVKFTIESSSAAEPCIDELEIYDETGENIALAVKGAKPSASGTLAGFSIHRLEHLNDGQTGNDRSWIANEGKGWVKIDLPTKTRINRIVWGRDRSERFKDRVATRYHVEAESAPNQWITVASSDDREPFSGKADNEAIFSNLPPQEASQARSLQREIKETEKQINALSAAPTAWLGTFSQPPKTHRLYRGEPQQPREVVAPDALSVMGSLNMAVDEPEQQRRLKLAQWMTSPTHTLTARVMVNRLWQYIFGTGLVSTPSDFGVNGAKPTHPELLDWLADEFVAHGWSIKHMQRLILRSATFQQDSAPHSEAIQADADALYLWRFPLRRLEAEAIRDTMLSVSGSLDLTMGGPGFSLMDIVEENVMHYFAKESFTPAEFRRMVYQFRIRQTTDSVFSSFDCPDGGQVMPKRSRSNTPLQALNLFNSSFALQQADLLTQRLKKEAGEDGAKQVERAFALFYGRSPDVWERESSSAFIKKEGLMAFCRALYNSSEFLFIF